MASEEACQTHPLLLLFSSNLPHLLLFLLLLLHITHRHFSTSIRPTPFILAFSFTLSTGKMQLFVPAIDGDAGEAAEARGKEEND